MTTLTEYGCLEPANAGYKGMFAKGYGTFPVGTIAAHRKAQYDLHRSRRDAHLADAAQFQELAAEAKERGCIFMPKAYGARAQALLALADAAERNMEAYDAAR